ncbi:MAG: hypothetical protein C4551_02330 [Bacillota bacterium]|nr:MAG: hypothetical protein C4551_02330 [Bacillota bacterium]
MTDATATWRVRRDRYGYACAIEYGGQTVLHLVPGSVLNEQSAEDVAELLQEALEAKNEGEWTARRSEP